MKDAKSLTTSMHASAKAQGESLVHVIGKHAFQAKRHGSQVWFYMDDKRYERASIEGWMQKAIEAETSEDDGSQFTETTAFASVRAPRAGLYKLADVEQPVPKLIDTRLVRFDLAAPGTHSVTVVNTAKGAHTFKTFGMPIRGAARTNGGAIIRKALRDLDKRKRADLYVGMARNRQFKHAIAIWCERQNIVAKKQTPNVAKRAKRLFKILRILNL